MAASRSPGRLAPWLAIALAVIALDQLAKGIVQASLPLHEGRTLRLTEEGRPFLRLAAAAFDAYLKHNAARHSVAV